MENYKIILKKVFNDEYIDDSEDYLIDYFVIIKEIGINEIIKSHEKFDVLIKKFEIKYRFNKFLLKNEEEQRKIFTKLVSSLKKELDENKQKIIDLFPLIIYLDFDNILFNIIETESDELKITLMKILNGFSCKMGVHSIPRYNWEVEAVEGYGEGHLTSNFIKIYETIDAFERGRRISRNSFLALTSCVMSKNFNNEFVECVDQRKDAVEIKILLENLEIEDKLKIAKKSENFLVKFEIIRELLYFNNNNIEETIINEISEILLNFTEDVQIWKNFIIYYILYPIRSPNFFIVLGKILNKIEKKFLVILFENLKIDEYINNEEFSIINNCFTEKKLKNKPVEIIYERWKRFIMNKKVFTTPILTNYINVIIYYIVNIMDDNRYKQEINECFYNIKEMNNFWFESKIEQRNFFYKNISYLFALGFREEHGKKVEIINILKRNFWFSSEEDNLISQNWRI